MAPVEHALFSLEGGQAAATRLLRHGVTGVICGSDVLALGAIRAVRRAGLSVPGDVSVVGYDDSAFMNCTDPPLTTVRQPIESMGKAAVALLVNQMEGIAATPRNSSSSPSSSSAAPPAQPPPRQPLSRQPPPPVSCVRPVSCHRPVSRCRPVSCRRPISRCYPSSHRRPVRCGRPAPGQLAHRQLGARRQSCPRQPRSAGAGLTATPPRSDVVVTTAAF